ncbi:SAF domain-containing protein [Sedimentibacter sp. LTW-03]|uniref:SAF domain-containing protein n=1 Tax=Sedimentibacter sp. LTW-03 TaxID=3453406 RepID=UPI003F8410E3
MRLKLKFSKLTMLAMFLIIIAGIIYYYEEINVKEHAVSIETIDVIVAADYVPENTVINKEMLTVEKRYIENINDSDNIAVKYDEIVGKRTIVPLYKGEEINMGRLVENKSYMNDEIQTQTVIKLTDVDKALKLQEGDYIDIWIEASSQGKEDEPDLEPYKFMDRMKVIKVYDKEYSNTSKNIEFVEGKDTSDAFIPEYITIQLNDAELKQFYNISSGQSVIRVSRYGREKFYNVVSDILKEGDTVE